MFLRSTVLNSSIVVCPACPKEATPDRKIEINIDGNFQLKRFASSGRDSIEAPEVLSTYFDDESSFEEFKVEYEQLRRNINSSQIRSECESSFRAADEKKALQKNQSKLDISGIVGTTCGHGIPLKFIDIRSGGERLVYGLFLLNSIIDKFGKNLIVMYDIACVMHKHIKVSNFYIT